MQSDVVNVSISFIIILLLSFTGCAIVHTGHHFDTSKILHIMAGETTKQEIINLFGEPENIVRKPSEGFTIFIYKSITSSSIAIPIPLGVPIFSIGKAKTTGYQLNIVIQDNTDKVLDYEFTELKERLIEF